jgi:hypothetical protein
MRSGDNSSRSARLLGQQPADASQEREKVERLEEEIVGAGLEDDVLDAHNGRHHEDGNMRRGGIGSDSPASLSAVRLRHHEVHHHQIGLFGRDFGQRLESVKGLADDVMLAVEVGSQKFDHYLKVINNKNSALALAELV